jgi:hypothetical protein
MENKILKTLLVNWKELKLFQPADLKKMSKVQLDKLRTSLKNNGFKTPFYVWENDNGMWCLDGHMRIPVLKLMESEGEMIPAVLPANFVDCKNREEAKKAVLIYNSHYANIQEDIFMDFISDLKFDEVKLEIDIPDLELYNFDFIKQDNLDNSDAGFKRTLKTILVLHDYYIVIDKEKSLRFRENIERLKEVKNIEMDDKLFNVIDKGINEILSLAE